MTNKSQAIHPKEYDDYRLCSAKNTAVQLSGVDESSLKLLHKDVPKRSSTSERHPDLPMMTQMLNLNEITESIVFLPPFRRVTFFNSLTLESRYPKRFH